MMLYAEMQKSLYRIPKPALLFYLNLVGDLTRAGLKINPHDPCVMNKIVGKEQITVMFHVENLKMLHKSDKAITKLIEYLDGIYPGLKAVCVDVHD